MMPKGHGHPIKVVARRTGLSPHLIRIWERRYKAVTPTRTDTNRRVYTDADIERFLLLHRLVRAGRSIGTVAHLDTSDLLQLVAEDEAKGIMPIGPLRTTATDGHPDSIIAAGLHAVNELDAAKLESVLRRASVSHSHQALIEQIIIPLMYRIGDLWRDGNYRIANEHVASVIVRNFLSHIVAAYEPTPNAPVIVLTTPAGQLHEFGAISAAAIAASEGWQTVYLGPNLPVEEVALAARKRQARVIGLSIVHPSDDPRLAEELILLRKLVPEGVAIIVGGSGASGYRAVVEKIGGKLVGDLITFRNQLDQVRHPRASIKDLT